MLSHIGKGGRDGDSSFRNSPVRRTIKIHRYRDSIEDEKTIKFLQELIAAQADEKNWKGIVISIICIILVISLIILAIYLVKPPGSGPRVKGRKITIADIISQRFDAKDFNGSWISENELLFKDTTGGLSVLNTKKLKVTQFVKNTTFNLIPASDNQIEYSLSPDRNFILFAYDKEKKWSHSSLSKYIIFDISKQVQVNLNTGHSGEPELIQIAKWGPVGNSIIFVVNNNIYYIASASSAVVTQITGTGVLETYFNGVPDWLYYDQILKSDSALWISPNGGVLLYASFNDTNVNEISFTEFEDDSQYPSVHELRYPMAGTNNPIATLWAMNLQDSSINSIALKPPYRIRNKEHYFSSIKWINDESISVSWSNRAQNLSVISICRAKSNWECEEIYYLSNKKSGWVDILDAPHFSNSMESCILRSPLRNGIYGYFHHIIWVNLISKKRVPLTQGQYEVTEISAWDQANKFIYFIATPLEDPGQRHLYKLKLSDKPSNFIVTPICLTCFHSQGKIESLMLLDELVETRVKDDAEDEANHTCLYNKVNFSPKANYFVRECLGPNYPFVSLHNSQNGALIKILDENSAIREEISEIGLPKVKKIKIEISGGYVAPVRLTLPPGFREYEDFQFPLLLYINADPGHQTVSEKWEFPWLWYLSSEMNYIILEIDGRGSGFQGEEVRHATYRKLGQFEYTDHTEVTKYLMDNFFFIDGENMAVLGQGYSGFLAAKILSEDDENIFKSGIAISPITNFNIHNSAFAEKYMGLPYFDDNFEGYAETDLSKIAYKFEDKNLILIHGTSDDNVNYQNTMRFSKTLIDNSILFNQMIYADVNHNYDGAQAHFIQYIQNHLNSTFDQFDIDEFEKANFLGFSL